MVDLTKKNNYEDRAFLIMPYNGRWYRLITTVVTTTTPQERCEDVYRRIMSDYSKPIAIMEVATKQAFVFSSIHEWNGNLVSVSCNKFEQFDLAN